MTEQEVKIIMEILRNESSLNGAEIMRVFQLIKQKVKIQ